MALRACCGGGGRTETSARCLADGYVPWPSKSSQEPGGYVLSTPVLYVIGYEADN